MKVGDKEYLGGHTTGFADIFFQMKSRIKSFSRKKQHQRNRSYVRLSTLCLELSSLYFLIFYTFIYIYMIFATFNFTKMNPNCLWSQEHLTVRYLWEDCDIFSTKIGICFRELSVIVLIIISETDLGPQQYLRRSSLWY